MTQTLGKPEATILRSPPSACAVRATRSTQRNAAKGKPEVDAGFRVYALADDPHALVHRTRLTRPPRPMWRRCKRPLPRPSPSSARGAGQPAADRGPALSATLTPLAAGSVADALWQAQDTLLVLDAVPLDALVDLLRQRKAAGTLVHHVSVYAPWVHDDNFCKACKPLLEAEGFSADRLRLRG